MARWVGADRHCVTRGSGSSSIFNSMTGPWGHLDSVVIGSLQAVKVKPCMLLNSGGKVKGLPVVRGSLQGLETLRVCMLIWPEGALPPASPWLNLHISFPQGFWLRQWEHLSLVWPRARVNPCRLCVHWPTPPVVLQSHDRFQRGTNENLPKPPED